MRFETAMIEGTFLRRERQFAATVRLETGEEVLAHCANSASLDGCADEGNKVLLSVQENPRSRYSHRMEIIYVGRTPVAVHAGRPAHVVAEAVTKGEIVELAGYATLRRDGQHMRNTRIDLVAEGNAMRPCHMKVEYVTLARDAVAWYPDTRVKNGAEMMSDLTDLVREGNRAVLMLLAPRADVSSVRLADDIDPGYTQALRDAVARGVELIGYRAKVTKRGIELGQSMEISLEES